MSTSPLWISQLTRTMIRKNNLKPSDLDIPDVRNPIYVSSADSVTGDKNMKATFLFKEGDGNYSGAELFTYETVNLEKLFKNNSVPVVWGYNPHTTKEIAKLLIDQYGLSLHEDWFVEEPVDGSTLPTHFTIKTKLTDWCSESQLTVRVEQSEKDVAELFTVDVLDAPKYIEYKADTLYGECRDNIMSTYSRDFTPRYIDEKEAMFGFVAGDTTIGYKDHPGFIAYVQDIIGDTATIYERIPNMDAPVQPGQILLNAYKILHNGTTKGTKFNNVSADTNYDRVLVIMPVIQYNGYREFTPMFLHYNDV